jgi:hypothetical protein
VSDGTGSALIPAYTLGCPLPPGEVDQTVTNTSTNMYAQALPLPSIIDPWDAPNPRQLDRPTLQEIWAGVRARKGLRSFLRDILVLILDGSLAEAAS